MLRVEKIPEALGMLNEAEHQFRLGQPYALKSVRGQEPILHVEKRRLTVFGRPPCDKSEIRGFLCVASK